MLVKVQGLAVVNSLHQVIILPHNQVIIPLLNKRPRVASSNFLARAVPVDRLTPGMLDVLPEDVVLRVLEHSDLAAWLSLHHTARTIRAVVIAWRKQCGYAWPLTASPEGLQLQLRDPEELSKDEASAITGESIRRIVALYQPLQKLWLAQLPRACLDGLCLWPVPETLGVEACPLINISPAHTKLLKLSLRVENLLVKSPFYGLGHCKALGASCMRPAQEVCAECCQPMCQECLWGDQSEEGYLPEACHQCEAQLCWFCSMAPPGYNPAPPTGPRPCPPEDLVCKCPECRPL